jgi:hypothetical protein
MSWLALWTEGPLFLSLSKNYHVFHIWEGSENKPFRISDPVPRPVGRGNGLKTQKGLKIDPFRLRSQLKVTSQRTGSKIQKGSENRPFCIWDPSQRPVGWGNRSKIQNSRKIDPSRFEILAWGQESEGTGLWGNGSKISKGSENRRF